jgi:coenzyme PQQ precursor peptide PqqA
MLSQIAFESQTKSTIAFKQESVMKAKVWIRPEVKEIHLGCEINSYAPAEI